MREAVHAEWTKLRTVPSTGWLVIAVIALTVGISALATSIVKCPATCGADTTKLSLTGILLGQAAVAALAVVIITAEYGTGMIRVSLAAVPRRAVLLAAKAIVVTGLAIGQELSRCSARCWRPDSASWQRLHRCPWLPGTIDPARADPAGCHGLGALPGADRPVHSRDLDSPARRGPHHRCRDWRPVRGPEHR